MADKPKVVDDVKAATLEVFADRLETGGASYLRVNDGSIFAFKVDVLETLLEQAKKSKSGKAIIFIQDEDPQSRN